MTDNLKLFAGGANLPLAKKIAQYIGTPLGKAKIGSFPDGEVMVEIGENVRGADVFIIQPTCPPVNRNLMELLIMMDAVRRSSAKRITAVIPYYGYGRQDRKVKPRVPISAKLVADLITAAGAHRVLTMDLHANQIQGFFNIPVDNLFAFPVLLDYFKKKEIQNPVVVSPDPGGVERARAFAKRLNASMAVIDKRRGEHGEPEVMHVVGRVSGKNAIIVDDMIDKAGTLVEAIKGLRQENAGEIRYLATHAILSPPAEERIRNSELSEVIVADTIPEKRMDKLTVLSVAPLLGEAIKRIHCESSVSSLFI